MDIDSLPAGTALDLAVGKRVMGFTPHYVGPGRMEGWDTDAGRRMEWSPSINIAHAWEVVERLGEMGVVWTTSKGRHIAVAHTWLGGERIEAIADTAPLAICRAALKAVSNGH